MKLRTFITTAILLLFPLSNILLGSSFELRPLKIYAEPGDRVLVPIVLTSSDSVAAWEILMSYDIASGSIGGVEPVDSIQAEDPQSDTPAWFYAPWAGHPDRRPEEIYCLTNVDGHPDRVRIIGYMDMISPPVTPPIPPGEDLLLFCFIFDVSSSWDGHDLLFSFLTYKCGDNTLSSPNGYTIWGPDTASAPPSTCPQRPNGLRVIRLSSGVGVGKQTMVRDREIEGINLKPILQQNSPNPFSHSTRINYRLPHTSPVKLTIWDATGRLQRILVDEYQLPGCRSVWWDGKDEDGNLLPNGVYFCRLETAGFRQSRKLLLLR